MRFILYAVYSAEPASTSKLIREAGNSVQSHRRLRGALVRHCDFDAVLKKGKRHEKVRMPAGQMFKCFLAGGDDGLLQFHHG